MSREEKKKRKQQSTTIFDVFGCYNEEKRHLSFLCAAGCVYSLNTETETNAVLPFYSQSVNLTPSMRQAVLWPKDFIERFWTERVTQLRILLVPTYGSSRMTN